MKKFFILPLFCVAVILTLPLEVQAKELDTLILDELVKCGCNATKPLAGDIADLEDNKNLFELVQFVAQLSALDEDELSPLHTLNDRIQNGDSIVLNDDFVEALTYAQAIMTEYNHQMSDDQIEELNYTFGVLLEIADIHRGCVSNNCGSNICKPRVYPGPRGKRGKRGKRGEVGSTGATGAFTGAVDTLLVCDLTVTCSATIQTLEVLTSVTTCDLFVGCNIFMNDSLSPAVGNVYKGGAPFIHNFGTDNTFVGENAGNFTSAGSDNTGLGYHALLNNNDTQLTAVGSGALENYQTSAFAFGTSNNVAVGYHALNANVSGNSNTAVGWSALSQDVTTILGQNTAIGWGALQTNTVGTDNTAVGNAAMFRNITGIDNTAVGSSALRNNTTGGSNTAVGYHTLLNNTTGGNNIAVGYQALLNNTTGGNNTASGFIALIGNTTGSFNTATGRQSMLLNSTGNENTATGVNTLFQNTTGNQNTAMGVTALQFNASGNRNVAIGHAALNNITTGSLNIAVGPSAGTNLNGANSNNIAIGNSGVGGDSGVIRIGTAGIHTRNFQAGIFGVAVAGVPVVIDGAGQLGVIPSSIRYKENVQDMNEKSSPIFNLRPVIFSYKADTSHKEQFGLIAEEVNKVMPALVVRGADGQIETVKYHELTSLLLNELIKQHRIIEKQNVIIEQQNNVIHDINIRLIHLESQA